MNLTKAEQLELSKEEMLDYGDVVIRSIVEHFDIQNDKYPVATASREEMDTLFSEEVPEKQKDAREVLNFVLQKGE